MVMASGAVGKGISVEDGEVMWGIRACDEG